MKEWEKYGELVEEVDLDLPCKKMSFLVDPLFLMDVVDKDCDLKYFPEKHLVLIEKGSFQLLIQTRQ